MTSAVEAYDRLMSSLRELQTHITKPAALSTTRQTRLRHDAAVQAVRRHARTTVAEFAFIDGMRVSYAAPGLLTVFYADPMSGVGSRYCWALLKIAPGAPPSLSDIVEASLLEHDEFTRRQRAELNTSLASGSYRALLIEEDQLQRRADRLGYTISILRRLLIGTRPTQESRQLSKIEQTLAQLEETADEVFRELRGVQLKRLRADRDE